METPDTPKSLLERLRRSPNDEGWGTFISLYQPLILRWLRRDPSLNAEAEDLAQETLLAAWRDLPKYDPKGDRSFRKWLRQIVAFRLLGHYRSRKRRPQQFADDGEPLSQLADDDSRLSRLWDSEYNKYIVERLLERVASDFSNTDVRAFRRYILDEVEPARKVADELGVTENVVLLAKSRILRRLRELGEGVLD